MDGAVMVTCPQCGEQNTEGTKFCGNCGARLGQPAGLLQRARRASGSAPVRARCVDAAAGARGEHQSATG